MKDFYGTELEVGDLVAFARNPYADLMVGKVVGFTPKGIKIIKKSKDGTWCEYKYETNKYEVIFPYQTCKIGD